MDEKLKQIRGMLAIERYSEAEAMLKDFMAEHPENWDARLLFAFCRQLQGDKETFRKIHDEAQAHIDAQDAEAEAIKASPLWRKCHKAWIAWFAVGALVVGAAVGAGMINYQALRKNFQIIVYAVTEGIQATTYDGPQHYERKIILAEHAHEVTNRTDE